MNSETTTATRRHTGLSSNWTMFTCWLMVLSMMGNLGVCQAKTCQIVERGKELKALVKESHVLVSLQTRKYDEEEDDEEDPVTGFDENYQSLCKRLEETPEIRVEDFHIVVVTDSNLKRKVLEESSLAPQGMLEQFLA